MTSLPPPPPPRSHLRPSPVTRPRGQNHTLSSLITSHEAYLAAQSPSPSSRPIPQAGSESEPGPGPRPKSTKGTEYPPHHHYPSATTALPPPSHPCPRPRRQRHSLSSLIASHEAYLAAQVPSPLSSSSAASSASTRSLPPSASSSGVGTASAPAYATAPETDWRNARPALTRSSSASSRGTMFVDMDENGEWRVSWRRREGRQEEVQHVQHVQQVPQVQQRRQIQQVQQVQQVQQISPVHQRRQIQQVQQQQQQQFWYQEMHVTLVRQQCEYRQKTKTMAMAKAKGKSTSGLRKWVRRLSLGCL